MRSFILGLILSVNCGCVADKAYREADKLTYMSIAPEIREYWSNDQKLSKEEKERRERLLRSWEARINGPTD